MLGDPARLMLRPEATEEQVQALFAATQGYLDDVEVAQASEFNLGLLDFLKSQYPTVGETIAKTQDLSDDIAQQLHEAIQAFKADYSSSVATAVEA